MMMSFDATLSRKSLVRHDSSLSLSLKPHDEVHDNGDDAQFGNHCVRNVSSV